jgi:hypothetical protein
MSVDSKKFRVFIQSCSIFPRLRLCRHYSCRPNARILGVSPSHSYPRGHYVRVCFPLLVDLG